MHQNAARCVMPRAAFQIDAGYTEKCLADRFDVIALVGEFGRIMQHQNRTARDCGSIARCLKVTAENLHFADAIVVQKSIGRFSVRPVLAHQGYAVAGTRRQLLQQRSKSLSGPLVFELAVGKLAIEPTVWWLLVENRSPSALSNSFVRHAPPCINRTRNFYISRYRHSCKNIPQRIIARRKDMGN